MLMKNLLCLAVLLLLALPAQAQLQWRISVKLIADVNGNPAPNAFNNISNELVLANQLLDGYGRGYRTVRWRSFFISMASGFQHSLQRH